MKTRNLLFVIVSLILSNITVAQNPFASIGKKSKPMLSLSNGKYIEHFENDSVRQVGSAMVNIYTEQIVAFVNREEQAKKDIPKTSSRFLSIDPLARQFPFYTPYQYAGNRPIECIDIDGLESVSAITFGTDVAYRGALVKKIDNQAVVSNLNSSNTIGQFVNAFRKASEADSKGIGFMAIFGHGTANGVFGADGSTNFLDKDDLSALKTAIANGEVKFAEGSTIYMGNCNAGTCDNNGSNFAQELANITGANVIAGSASNEDFQNDHHAGSVGKQKESLAEGEMSYNMYLPKVGDFKTFKKGQEPSAIGNIINILPLIMQAKQVRDKIESIPIKTIETAQRPEPEIKL